MYLLRFFVAHYDIVLMSEHIAGTDNCTADHLSRNNIRTYFPFLLIHRLHLSQHQFHHSSSSFSQFQDQIGPQQPSSSCFFLLSERTSPLHSNTLPCWQTEVHPLLHSAQAYCTSSNRTYPALFSSIPT